MWDGDVKYRPASGRTVDLHPPAQYLDTVFEPDEPGALSESAPPMPSSEIDRLRLSPVVRARILISEAEACLAALVSASATTKYAAISMESGDAA